ncbi:MAG: protein kinase family protein [Spirochaetales bacterium]|jgi:serine/threonine-protein kinase|nr:protein kinase family protein [Spirochaetales bacterium]
MDEKIVEFLRKKDYKLIRNIGRGGTAITVLLKDELIDKEYVCKKYLPIKGINPKEYFNNFLTEIKLLHEISHPNIVRVYNYYLYPERYTGYLLMEHIDGETISSFISKNPEKINSIFEQTINGFKYLEEHNILHRDIRDTNILITKDGIVKIIDFGFGKKIFFPDDTDKSISLTWWCDIPDEFSIEKYGKDTEVYFVGKLFEYLLQQNQIENFLYYSDLQMMVEKNPQNRLGSFILLENNLSKKSRVLDFFDDQEKKDYRYFADSITRIITSIGDKSTYNNFENIIQRLEEVYQKNMLESDIKNPVSIIRVFLNGSYYCDKNNTMSVGELKNFIDLLKTCSNEKLRVITMNLYNRFDSIERYAESDIPF